MSDKENAVEAIDLAIEMYQSEIRRLTGLKYTFITCNHPNTTCINGGTMKTGYIYYCSKCLQILKKPPPAYKYEKIAEGDISKTRQKEIDSYMRYMK